MRLATLTVVPLLCAGAAFAQVGSGQREVAPEVEPGCERPSDLLVTAKKAFVDNYQAASKALAARDWTGVIGGAALARQYVTDGRQEQALIELEVAAYRNAGNDAVMAERIEAYLALPCTQPAIREKYQQMLERIEAEAAARQPQ